MSRLIPGHDALLVGSVQVSELPATPVASSEESTWGVELLLEDRGPGPAPSGSGVGYWPRPRGSAAPSVRDTPVRPRDSGSPRPWSSADDLAARPRAADAPRQFELLDQADNAAAPDPAAGAALVALWQEYRAEPSRSHRDQLVLHYLTLVRGLARRLATGLPPHVELGDLAQSGMFGLIEAIERFDPACAVRFESFASPRIRGAMLDELRAQDWVPRTVRGRSRQVQRARERLEATLGRGVSEREIAAEAGLTPGELRAAARQLQLLSVEALDELAGGPGALSDNLVDDTAGDPVAVVQSREAERLLSAAVGQLGERDQIVINLYYVENCTLAEIGRRLGVTESRVCQLHSRLVARLRDRLVEPAAV